MTKHSSGVRRMVTRLRLEFWAWKEAKKIESDDYEFNGTVVIPTELAGRRLVNGVLQPPDELD